MISLLMVDLGCFPYLTLRKGPLSFSDLAFVSQLNAEERSINGLTDLGDINLGALLACINFRTLCGLIVETYTTTVRADSYTVYSYFQPTSNLPKMHSSKAI